MQCTLFTSHMSALAFLFIIFFCTEHYDAYICNPAIMLVGNCKLNMIVQSNLGYRCSPR